MTITRKELLAKCPKLAELRENHEALAINLASEASLNPFYIGPRDEDEAGAAAKKDFDAALDEVLAIIKPPAAPEPKPAPMRGIAVVNSRKLCTFTGGSAKARPIPELKQLLALGKELPEQEWDWVFTGAVFFAPAFGFVVETGEKRKHVTLMWGFVETDTTRSEACAISHWSTEQGKTSVEFAFDNGSCRFTESETP